MENKQIATAIEKLKTELRSWYSKVSVNEITKNQKLLKRIAEIEDLLIDLGRFQKGQTT